MIGNTLIEVFNVYINELKKIDDEYKKAKKKLLNKKNEIEKIIEQLDYKLVECPMCDSTGKTSYYGGYGGNGIFYSNCETCGGDRYIVIKITDKK